MRNRPNEQSDVLPSDKDDVYDSEIECAREMVQHLDFYRTRLPDVQTSSDDDDMCTICYAYPVAATFKPCNHQSCRACIDRHLLNSRECFFCKAKIHKVVNVDGNVSHDFSKELLIHDTESIES